MFKSISTLVLLLVFFVQLNGQNYSSLCNDGVKNGLEIDIDCGGVCVPCEEGLESGLMITVDETDVYEYRHAIWLPPGYDMTNEYRELPLIVFLHGNGELNFSTTAIQNYGPMRYRNNSWWDYPFIIVNPVRGGNIVADEITSFVDRIIEEYHVDESHIYITGISAGAFGVAGYVFANPDKAAGVASISGYAPYISSICADFKGTPVWYFHNIGDGSVPFNLATIDDLGKLHSSCGEPQPDPYTFMSIFDSNGHNAWSRVFDPFLNESDPSTYASQYNLADLTYLTEDQDGDEDYDDYQVPFGIPNGAEILYDWFLRYENVPNSCRNQIMDNDETGIDCGGSCKPCTATYNCHNGVLDSGETAIDCGGACPKCERDITWRNAAWNNTTGPESTDQVILLEDFTGSLNCTNLTIAAGATLTINGVLEVKESLLNEGSLVITSGASLITYDGMEVSENVVIRRTTRYADGKYSFVGSPVEADESVTTADLGNVVYSYDESRAVSSDDLARWTLSNGDEGLETGRGYAQAYLDHIEFVGKPNTGTINYTAGYVNDGWHLVSNPYPAAISLDEFLTANQNTTGAIYIWDDNNSQTGRGSNDDYIIVNRTAAIDLNGPENGARWNGYIGSVQGFFMQLSSSAGTITFNEGMRVSGNNADENFFRKKNQNPLMRINLTSNDGLVKQTVIGWNENALDYELLSGYDAPIINTNAEYNIYSYKSEKQLAIQTITSKKEQVPLGYQAGESGVYAISFALEGLDESYYLIDNLELTSVDIFDGLTYSFSSAGGRFDDRFTIMKQSEVLDIDDQQAIIYTYQKTLYILSEGYKQHYRVYNLQGKVVKEATVSGAARVSLNSLPKGVYIVSNGKHSKKVIL